MPPPFRFTRLQSSNVVFQAHAREDSRYVILAVMEPASVRAWTVYDVESGRVISPQPFRTINDAKSWINKEYPDTE